MKTSELIEQLKKSIEQHGDLKIIVNKKDEFYVGVLPGEVFIIDNKPFGVQIA